MAPGKSSKRGNIHVVYAIPVHIGSKVGIQGMDSFHKQHIVLFKLHTAGFIENRTARLEVELGDYDLLACKQIVQILVQQVHIHSTQGLKIVFAVFVLGSMLAVQEVIVQLNDFGVQPEHLTLLGDAKRTAGLSA